VSTVRALATLLGALMLLLVLGLLVLGTPQGSAWLIGNIADLAGDRLSLTGIRGTLLEGLAVDRLQISAGRTTVVIEPAELRMNWPDLLRRRVRLTTARAALVRIDIAPRPLDEARSVVQPLLLPVAIAVESLEITRLVIRNGVNQEAISTEQIVPVEIGPVTLRGELVAGVLRFESLQAALYGITAQASGAFGTGEPFALEAQLAWQLADPAVTGSGALKGNLAALRFEQVVRLPSPVGVGGVAHLLQDQPEILAEARWADLQQSLGEGPDLLLRSDAGRLSVRGWTSRYVAQLNTGVRLGDWPKAQALATAHGTFEGDTRELEIQSFQLDGFGGQVTGTGRIALQDAVVGSLQLQGRGIDPRFLDPRFAGRVDVRSAIDFDSVGNFRVQVPEASGTLFKRPLRASGTVTRNPRGLAFDDVRVLAGVNRVEFSGQLDDQVDGKRSQRLAGSFRIDAPDLVTLWPDYQGQLRGTGKLAGTTAEPSLDLDLAGSGLVAGELRIQSLQARGGGDARQRLVADVAAAGLSWSGKPLGNLSLRVAGRLDAQTVEVALAGGDVEARLSATGTYKNGIVTQTIGTGLVTVQGNDRWTLREPTTVRAEGSAVGLTAHCWVSGDTELCLADARYDQRGFSGGLDLRNFSLARLAPWLPPDIGLTGTAAAAVTVQREGGRLTGTLQGGLQDALITWRVPDDEDVQTEISEFKVSAALADDVLDFEAVVAESFGLRLATSGRVTGPLGEQPKIVADLNGGVPDLASLGPLVERLVDVGDVQGKISVAATLSGNARRPDFSGGLQLDEGAFTVPAAGITVDRISLALQGQADGRVGIKGNARSGKGYVALDGTLAWRDQLAPSAEATVKGRVIDVIRLPEGLVQVSPDVRVVLRDGQFHVGGEMLVPRAEIRLKKLDERAVQTSPDTIVHGRDVAVVDKSPSLFVLDDLQVTLGEKVSFEGFGLKTGLTGGLLINQSPGTDAGLVTGSGVVSLREGQFSAFGQKLAIERGSLLFSGIVTDPGLDVKASRDLTYEGRDVTVGVLLSGRLSRIVTRVFSEPAMGELDALSYLTTGKPLSAAGAGDRSTVSSAAISLGLNQALPVVQQLSSALKVDELGMDTTEAGGTAVVVGEQLGKNLFLRYSYGVFDNLGTVKATYKLGRRISIEASSGEEQSLDLIYSINW
jgi:translocation and assembly module TamB